MSNKNKNKNKNKKRRNKMKIIASAFNSSSTFIDNYRNHKRAINALANFGLKPVEVVGSYDGEEELSLLITLPLIEELTIRERHALIRKISELFFLVYNQDSILYIRDNGEAFLQKNPTRVKGGNYREYIGFWFLVTEEEARRSIGFSYINGEFFICKEIRPRFSIENTEGLFSPGV
jgi:hypothetical protein